MRQISDVEGKCVVSVTAQVMKRDDLCGYWMPHEQGGYSNIQLLQFYTSQSPSSSEESNSSSLNSLNSSNSSCVFPEYQIVGDKVQERVLDCPLRLGVIYERPTPTFHHWSYEEDRYGLTFISPGDARLFYTAVDRALKHLAGEIEDCLPNDSANVEAGDREVPQVAEQSQPTVESLRNVSPDTSTEGNIGTSPDTPPRPAKPLHLHKSLSNESSPALSSPAVDDTTQDVWILRDDLNPPPLYPRRDKAVKSLRHSKPLPVPTEDDKRRLNEYSYVDLVPKSKDSYSFHELSNTRITRQQSAVSDGELSATSCTRLLNTESVLQEVMLPYKKPVCKRCSGRDSHERSLQCWCCGQEPRLYSNPQPKAPSSCTCSSRRPAMRRTLDALIVLLTCVWCKREHRSIERSSRHEENNTSKNTSSEIW